VAFLFLLRCHSHSKIGDRREVEEEKGLVSGLGTASVRASSGSTGGGGVGASSSLRLSIRVDDDVQERGKRGRRDNGRERGGREEGRHHCQALWAMLLGRDGGG
jgi:hypothetical protein